MSGKIQHKLLNLEAIPPPIIWEHIACWLDADTDSPVPSLADKLRNMETYPPAEAWQHIEAALNAGQDFAERPPLVPFFLRPIPLAASLAGLLIMIGIYFRSTSGTSRALLATTTKTEKKLSPAEALNKRQIPHAKLRSNYSPDRYNDSNYLNNMLADNGLSKNVSYNEEDDEDELVYTEPEATEIAPDGGFVSAPPIRDAYGNIIMDVKLVMTPDNNYIIITAPNGDQTKISRKFITAVCYLNTGVDTKEYFDPFVKESTLWKLRFQEWRNQLMKKASFIPASTNFLDILELKEIITDSL